MPKRTIIRLLILLLLLATAQATSRSRAAPRLPTEDTQAFTGRALRFDLPAGYRVLEATDGGCFIYHESTPGFLVLYRTTASPEEALAGLLGATSGLHRTESPLQVEIGGMTFAGLFVETEADERIFLAAAEGWSLVSQGSAGDWLLLATGLNQVLHSLSFEED